MNAGAGRLRKTRSFSVVSITMYLMISTTKYLFIPATRSTIKIVKRATFGLRTFVEIQHVCFNLHEFTRTVNVTTNSL